MSDAYSGVGPDYDLVPVGHDPFADVGASMARHLTGNPAAGPGQNPAQAFLDWRNSGQSWADQYHDYAQRAQAGPQAAIEAAGNPMDLFGGFVGSTAPEGGGLKGITAYHGSPYDFNRFDLSKIGTGEGAQAYGHGLYFAENEGTARSYRDALSSDPWRQATEITPTLPKQYQGSRDAGRRILQDIQDALASGEIKKPEDFTSEYAVDPALRPAYEKAASIINSKGKMYQVSIAADPGHFLDWDKPLSEQSPKVQEAIKGLNVEAPLYPDTPGQHIPGFISPDRVQQTDVLRQAGIPGIKYLDQGSRFQPQQVAHLNNQISQLQDMLAKDPGNTSVAKALEGRRQELAAVKPTSNFVVFDDSLISILKKYGIAGLIAGGGAHFSTAPVDHNPFASGMARGGRVGRKARVAAILQRHGIAA